MPDVAPYSGPDPVLAAAARGVRRRMTLATVLACTHQACEALVPVLVGVVVDRAVDGGSGGSLLMWLAVLALDFVALSLSFRFGSRSAVRAAEQSAHTLRVALAGRLLAAEGGADRDRLPGELLSVATSDAQQVGRFTTTLTTAAGAVVALALAAVLLLRMSVPLGLLVLLGTPAVLVGMNRLGRPLERKGAAEQAAAARAAGTAVDLVAGLRVLKGLRAERPAYARYVETNRASLRATVSAARAEALLDGGAVLFAGILVTAVALVAGRLAVTGAIGLGDLIACAGLCQFLIGPAETLMTFGPDLARARASAGRVAAVLDAPSAASDGRAFDSESDSPSDSAAYGPRDRALPETTPGGLRLRDLTTGRVHGLSLALAPGEHVGVVATDAALVADLLSCLSGDTLPESGSVLLDGAPLTALPLETARAAVLVAPHHPYLFDGTVLDNLRPGGAGEAARAADARALAAAAADEVVDTLPAGPDSRIGEHGGFLSGGQRQRVALARALRADPPVLVLHEPTTAVDSVTEARIADGVRALRAGRTTLVVTSSPTLLAACDRVVLLAGGAVAADAPHAALTGHPGYRDVVFA